MTLSRSLKWIAGILLAPVALAVLFIAVFGWNWLRAPIERMTTERTGRVLAINGDLTVKLGWPSPHIRAAAVSFANPPWAKEKQMVAADAVDVTVHLPQLLARNIVLPEVRLERPVVFLEQASDGRRNWLLDLDQQDEQARIRIDRLTLDQGRLGYDDVGQKTSIRAELSTSSSQADAAAVSFSAQGQYKGMRLKGSGKGGPVLGLRDEATPYPLQTEFSVGHTAAKQAASAPVPTAAPTPVLARVLPDLPFNTDRWDSVDAEVTLKAKTFRHSKELPLEDLVTHLSLRDSVLKLDPLDFGVAGGQLNAVISLDGRSEPIQAHARIKARKILLGQLFPTSELGKASIGQLNGDFDLRGTGSSVRQMLASSAGKVDLVIAGGKVSKMMMEKAGLHLWEILELSVTGDRLVTLRCAVAGFDVKQGNMQANGLIFDTEVTTIAGTGSIDLGEEKLDLTLNQKTKYTSPVALRSPIYLRGSFAKPAVSVDKGRVAVRALGAVALGLVNPLLTLIPLIDAGPGNDSDCGELVREARALPRAPSKNP